MEFDYSRPVGEWHWNESTGYFELVALAPGALVRLSRTDIEAVTSELARIGGNVASHEDFAEQTSTPAAETQEAVKQFLQRRGPPTAPLGLPPGSVRIAKGHVLHEIPLDLWERFRYAPGVGRSEPMRFDRVLAIEVLSASIQMEYGVKLKRAYTKPARDYDEIREILSENLRNGQQWGPKLPTRSDDLEEAVFDRLTLLAGVDPGHELSHHYGVGFKRAYSGWGWHPYPKSIFAACWIRLIELAADYSGSPRFRVCQFGSCDAEFEVRTGRGRPRLYCDAHITNQARFQRRRRREMMGGTE